MNDATIAVYDVHNSRTQLDSRAGQACRVLYLIDTKDGRDRQIREDRSFYVPDLLSGDDYDAHSQAYSAATDHAKHLHEAERLVDEAKNLVALMRAAISDEFDARAMQSETALTIIEKKLRKAHSHVDKHDRRHTNLFLAYFGLKDKAEEGVRSD